MHTMNNRSARGRNGSGLLLIPLLLALSLTGNGLHAGEEAVKVVEVKLGDYRFVPDEIRLVAGQPVVLRMENTDLITPHNFTLKDPGSDLDVDVDIPAGRTVDVALTPPVAGRYTFYCNKKLLFMKSHREKGMEGTLIVLPE